MAAANLEPARKRPAVDPTSPPPPSAATAAAAAPTLPDIRNILVSEETHWGAFQGQVASAHPDRTLVALDAEWHDGRLCLVQIAFSTAVGAGGGGAGGRAPRPPPPIVVFTIDCISTSLSRDSIAGHLHGILADVRIRKLFFDCREDCRMLQEQLGVPPPQGLFDLQLLERLTRIEIGGPKKPIHTIKGLKAMIAEFPSLARFLDAKSSQDLTAAGSSAVFAQRPLPQAVLDYASCDVASLFTLFGELQQRHLFRRNPARVTDATVRGSMIYARR